MLRLILKENSFHFNGKNYLQTHGTAMGTKMAVSFANIFMAAVETMFFNHHVQGKVFDSNCVEMSVKAVEMD